MKSNDLVRSVDRAIMRGIIPRVVDRGLWSPLWSIDKFQDRKDRILKAGRDGVTVAEIRRQWPDLFKDRLVFPGNLLLNEGINELWSLVTGTGGVKFDHDNAYIGVGDDGAAAGAGDTKLKAETNTTDFLYVVMDTSYPTYGSSQKATWRSTFGAADMNDVWAEITVANGDEGTNHDNLNRKVQAMGTKAINSTWVATLEITLA
jgi:hypothetical protein